MGLQKITQSNPIHQYVPVYWTGKKAGVATLQSSWAAATSFSPCSYLVNNWTLQVKSEKTAKALQGLHYLAKPIDAVIQAIAMPIFTVIDHIRGLGRGSLLDVSFKILCSPVSLPLKLFCSLFVSAGYLFNGGLQLVIPYSMIFGIAKGKEAALRYFYEVNEISNIHSHKIFVKPLRILPLKHNDDLNPFCKRRNELFLAIDPEFRDFNNSSSLDLVSLSDEDETNNIKKYDIIRCKCERVINEFNEYCGNNPEDRDSAHYTNLRTARNKAKADLQEIVDFFKKREQAESKFKLIREISEFNSPLLVNNGLPFISLQKRK